MEAKGKDFRSHSEWIRLGRENNAPNRISPQQATGEVPLILAQSGTRSSHRLSNACLQGGGGGGGGGGEEGGGGGGSACRGQDLAIDTLSVKIFGRERGESIQDSLLFQAFHFVCGLCFSASPPVLKGLTAPAQNRRGLWLSILEEDCGKEGQGSTRLRDLLRSQRVDSEVSLARLTPKEV